MRRPRHELEHKLGNAVIRILPDDARFILLYREAPEARLRIVTDAMLGNLVAELRAMADWLEEAQPEGEVHNAPRH